MTDRITFACTSCGHALVVSKSKPPKDDDMIVCAGCGREIGTYAVVRAALVKAGKAEVEKIVKKALGNKFKLKWKPK